MQQHLRVGPRRVRRFVNIVRIHAHLLPVRRLAYTAILTRTVKATAVTVLSIALIIYAALCLFVYVTQRSLIYFPTPEVETAAARALRIDVDGAVLKVWNVTRPGARAALYFGGNAEDVAAEIVPLAGALPDYSLYLVNYRGYGGSSGTPTEAAIVKDAIALFDKVHEQYSRVAVIGRSLGSGVAAGLAAERPIDRLVLVTPYDSLERVARRHYWYLPISWLLQDKFDSLRRAARISAPVLVVIAGLDEIIPRDRSEALVAAFRPGQVQVAVLAGAMHNFSPETSVYLDAVRGFL